MTLEQGRLILNDKYRIEEKIGAGAFAQVYRAMHLELQVSRALKILRRHTPGIGGSDFANWSGRFILEAQLGARITHPNVIQVHDFQQEGDTLVLVMEYAAGGNLKTRIERAREASQLIPVDECVRIALDVATGLSAIHELDVVHRDLKPSNILFDDAGRAKVADLGLAQIPGSSKSRSIGEGSHHPGTLPYMSPEQERTFEYLTPPSDIYALGIVLLEMLTGRLYKNLKPGMRTQSLRTDTPDWLDGLIAHMLLDNPRERPWDGREVARLLRSGMMEKERFKPELVEEKEGAPESALPNEGETVSSSGYSRFPKPAIVAVVAVLVFLCLGVALWQASGGLLLSRGIAAATETVIRVAALPSLSPTEITIVPATATLVPVVFVPTFTPGLPTATKTITPVRRTPTVAALATRVPDLSLPSPTPQFYAMKLRDTLLLYAGPGDVGKQSLSIGYLSTNRQIMLYANQLSQGARQVSVRATTLGVDYVNGKLSDPAGSAVILTSTLEKTEAGMVKQV